jgi:K+-sensing histidine kinase KdpD
LAGSFIPARTAQAQKRARSTRALLFVLECALGNLAVLLIAALAHWSSWLLPVTVLIYLLIVVATALLCGFWQAVIVSLSAVAVQALLSSRHGELNAAVDPVNSVTLIVFVLVALTVSRLSLSVTDHAREAELQSGQMHDLYEFTRRTLQMNLHV